ncbi:hypothetical protein [Acidipropionibacterium timonense]|uniref:hypothetical protein n=1 Tax=Acidipropionibacterium timonense TaxID=2161818 RepID=UPI0014368268|nr:hypothetical protein [Acidipropionibacterium timonense]
MISTHPDPHNASTLMDECPTDLTHRPTVRATPALAATNMIWPATTAARERMWMWGSL